MPLALTLLLACALGAAGAWAQYPSRPVKLVSPFPPGGGVDIVGRLVAQGLSPRLGQPVILENMAGASGTIGTQAAARAVPDGHTLLFAVPSSITIAENFAANPEYNPGRDLLPVALVGRYFSLLVINPSMKASSLAEFIVLAKANPKKYFYGTPGQGHAFHLLTELFAREAGVEMVHVPYRGSGPALVGLLAGDVQFMVQSSGAVKEYLRNGRLRAIATLESSRLEGLPEIPTLAESGMANLNIVNWFGVFVPSRTPREIIERLERELLALQRERGFVQKMKEQNYGPAAIGSREFARIIELERQRWRRVIQAAGITASLQ